MRGEGAQMGDHSPDGGSRPPRSYLKLRGLHRAMLAKGLTRVIFTGSNHGSTVETLFCADDDPMVLCVAVTHPAGTPTCAFEWEVQMPDYRVNTHLGDKYSALLDALDLNRPGFAGGSGYAASPAGALVC